MTGERSNGISLRLERLDTSRLVKGLVISVLIHLLCWGSYTTGKRYQLWEKLAFPAWVKKLTPALFNKPLFPNQPVREQEVPLMFVNVNPTTATPEPPKDAKYYSNLNSKAANPEADRDTDTPKLTGKQEHVPDTETVERNKFDRLRPVPPTEQLQPEPEERARSKPEVKPGDLAMAKPELNPRTDTGNAEKTRPRRLVDVSPDKFKRPPSQMLKQEGGVRHRLDSPSLDTKSTVTGQYDYFFIQAVKERWLTLLDERNNVLEGRGHVVLHFKLHYDGRITEMNVDQSTVSDTLGIICQKAVLDPAPFDKWSKEMRLMIGKDFREITFTFYYE